MAQSSPADKLRQFLLGIADSLQAGAAAGEHADLRPAPGSLISIAA